MENLESSENEDSGSEGKATDSVVVDNSTCSTCKSIIAIEYYLDNDEGMVACGACYEKQLVGADGAALGRVIKAALL